MADASGALAGACYRGMRTGSGSSCRGTPVATGPRVLPAPWTPYSSPFDFPGISVWLVLQLSSEVVTAWWARPPGARMHAALAAPPCCIRRHSHAGTLQLLLSAGGERREGECRIHTTALPLRCFMGCTAGPPPRCPCLLTRSSGCARVQGGALSLRE